MRLDLQFRELRPPRLSSFPIAEASRRLREITARNLARLTEEPESVQFKNRKEELKLRLMRRGKSVSLQEATTGVGGRERLLLSLYLEYTARSDAPWLPPFDEEITTFLLGSDGGKWHTGRRRQATLLFFMHFDRLPALEKLSALLSQAYQLPSSGISAPVAAWHQQATEIFNLKGPQRVAAAAKEEESLTHLSARFGIPESGGFSARLKECYLLSRLERVEHGKGEEILQQLETLKSSPYEEGIPLGAAALRIMIRRVLQTGGHWKGDWAEWILRLGCDPGLPSSSETFGKWWGCWHPTRAELDCARRAVNRQTLEYFIDFLETSLSGIPSRKQFEARAGFLRWLDDTRKILRFKLILHPHAFQKLPIVYRQPHRVTQIDGATQGTSVIVMECTDEIWIVEGTHSFAIRVLHKNFPLPEVFAEERGYHSYWEFTQGEMHRYGCPGIWKSHNGDWIRDLFWLMKQEFHVEWSPEND